MRECRPAVPDWRFEGMKKTYRVVGKRTEIYANDYEADSKADAIRQFNEDVNLGVEWYDSGRLTVTAEERR